MTRWGSWASPRTNNPKVPCCAMKQPHVCARHRAACPERCQLGATVYRLAGMAHRADADLCLPQINAHGYDECDEDLQDSDKLIPPPKHASAPASVVPFAQAPSSMRAALGKQSAHSTHSTPTSCGRPWPRLLPGRLVPQPGLGLLLGDGARGRRAARDAAAHVQQGLGAQP